jgi:hypothetical protein
VNSKKTAVLVIPDILTEPIPGLGSRKPLQDLGPKRITKAVRDTLRKRPGHSQVKVSCCACLQSGVWTGHCKIDAKPYQYTIQ